VLVAGLLFIAAIVLLAVLVGGIGVARRIFQLLRRDSGR
jgi:hypothetical protein